MRLELRNSPVRIALGLVLAGLSSQSANAGGPCPAIRQSFNCTDPGGRLYELKLDSIPESARATFNYEIQLIGDVPRQPTIWAITDGVSRLVMHGPVQARVQSSTCNEMTIAVHDVLTIDRGSSQLVATTDYSFVFSSDFKRIDQTRFHSVDSQLAPIVSHDICVVK